jgi:uncharacterized protein GlcG (DUF336 family)
MAKLTLEQAQKAVEAGLAKARELGSPSSIAIVDDGRNLLAFARMDGALLASIEISVAKAYTARSLNMQTRDVGPLTQPGQPLYGLETTHRQALVTFGGGQPISLGGEIVGGLGVAGGTVDQDQEVGDAAVAALGA